MASKFYTIQICSVHGADVFNSECLGSISTKVHVHDFWRPYLVFYSECELSMVSRHDRAVKPSVISSAEKSLCDALRSSADQGNRFSSIEVEYALRWMDDASLGSKSDFGCSQSVTGIL